MQYWMGDILLFTRTKKLLHKSKS